MSMIIGRKQIILAALVLALGTAIFLNWRFSGDGINFANVFNNSSALGDASYVANTNGNSVFATARLTRQQSRDEAENTIKTLMENSAATAADKQAAQTQISAIAQNITTEGTIESLIKAKGFSDCVAFINNGTVNVVVKPKSGSALSDSEVAQVQDIVIQQTKIPSNNIQIIPAK